MYNYAYIGADDVVASSLPTAGRTIEVTGSGRGLLQFPLLDVCGSGVGAGNSGLFKAKKQSASFIHCILIFALTVHNIHIHYICT